MKNIESKFNKFYLSLMEDDESNKEKTTDIDNTKSNNTVQQESFDKRYEFIRYKLNKEQPFFTFILDELNVYYILSPNDKDSENQFLNGNYGLRITKNPALYNQIKTMAVDADDNMYINSEFAKKLTDKELAAVIIHEILHIALQDLINKKDRDMLVWNFATDCVNNWVIEKDIKYKLPVDCIIPDDNGDLKLSGLDPIHIPNMNNVTAVRLYNELMRNIEKQQNLRQAISNSAKVDQHVYSPPSNEQQQQGSDSKNDNSGNQNKQKNKKGKKNQQKQQITVGSKVKDKITGKKGIVASIDEAGNAIINPLLNENISFAKKFYILYEEYNSWSQHVNNLEPLEDDDNSSDSDDNDGENKSEGEKNKKSNKKSGNKPEEENKENSSDNQEEKSESKKSGKRGKEYWDQKIEDAKQLGKLKSGSNMERRLSGDLDKSKINWREALRNILNKKIIETFKTPNRRAAAIGYYKKSEKTLQQMVNVVIAIDTSGSIDELVYKTFVSEIVGLLNTIKKEDYNIKNIKIPVLFWHTNVTNELLLSSNNTVQSVTDLIKAKIESGGTDINCIAPYIKKKVKSKEWVDMDPEVIIYLTDGEFDPPKSLYEANNKYTKQMFIITNFGTTSNIEKVATSIYRIE